jgi:putative membrane protein
MDFVINNYALIKALHLIAVISWMAGLFYLPRLYAYHAGVAKGSETSELFKVMERRLLKIIMNPAMILSFLLGGLLLSMPELMKQGWIHIKLLLVLGMAGLHGFLAVCRKDFENDKNTRSPKFYKIINEVPTVLMIAIVLLAVVKPF